MKTFSYINIRKLLQQVTLTDLVVDGVKTATQYNFKRVSVVPGMYWIFLANELCVTESLHNHQTFHGDFGHFRSYYNQIKTENLGLLNIIPFDFTKPDAREYSETLYLSSSRDDKNVWHFLFHCLPRLILFLKFNPGHDCKYYLGYKPTPYQLELLGLFVNLSKVLTYDLNPDPMTTLRRSVLFNSLIFIELPYQPTIQVVNLLRETLLGYGLSLETTYPDKIFINRRDAGNRDRYLSNIEEIESYLTRIGFTSISLSTLTAREQIKLFARAKSVVYEYGAGAVHLVFCSPCTTVIELCHPRNRNKIDGDICDVVSRINNLTFHRIEGELDSSWHPDLADSSNRSFSIKLDRLSLLFG
jgi:hypothetical protein